MNTDSLRYAGFWPRLASLLLDCVVILPLGAIVLLCEARYRLFSVYYFLPGILFQLFYSVYLVKRFGGTPGKLMMGIRIRKLDGESIGYREAILRELPGFILWALTSFALLFPLFHMSDAEYHSLSIMERARRTVELAPSWYRPLNIIQNVWSWGELLVLLTNRKRRALHDFVAGTVVVHVSKDLLEPAGSAPIALPGT